MANVRSLDPPRQRIENYRGLDQDSQNSVSSLPRTDANQLHGVSALNRRAARRPDDTTLTLVDGIVSRPYSRPNFEANERWRMPGRARGGYGERPVHGNRVVTTKRNKLIGGIGRAFAGALMLLYYAAPQPVLAMERLSIGTLSLDWPDGYSSDSLGDALLLRAPGDERVIVSYLRGRNHFAKEQRLRFARMHRDFALRTLTDMATNRGAMVQPLTISELADGTVVYSTASRVRHATRESYYLQYFVVGPFSAALFKLEGEGQTLRQKKRFDAVFASVRWNEVRVNRHIQ